LTSKGALCTGSSEPLRRHAVRPNPPLAPRCPSVLGVLRFVDGVIRVHVRLGHRSSLLRRQTLRASATPDTSAPAVIMWVPARSHSGQTITVSGRRLTVRRAEPTEHAGHFNSSRPQPQRIFARLD
jgi:hypothetical protein